MVKFVPPESGNLPPSGKKTLKEVYTGCAESTIAAHGKGVWTTGAPAKRICSAVAWNAVKEGFKKVGDQWRRK